MGHVLDQLQPIGERHQAALADHQPMLGRGGPVLVAQLGQAELAERRRDLGADVGVVIGRRQAGLGGRRNRPMAAIATGIGGAAGGARLARFERIAGPERAELDPHVIEDEEAELGRQQAAVGDPGLRQMRLGAQCHRAGIALVAHAGRGLGAIAEQAERRLCGKWIQKGAREVRAEQQIGLADIAPARHRRAVDQHAMLELLPLEARPVDRRMPPAAGEIGEAEIDTPDPLRLDPLEQRVPFSHSQPPQSRFRRLSRRRFSSLLQDATKKAKRPTRAIK